MSPVLVLAAGGRVMPIRAWLLVAARLDQGRNRGSPVQGILWSFHGWSPVESGASGAVCPSGGVERPRRMVRFVRLMHRRVRAFWPAFGRRRLRRQSQPDLSTTQGGTAWDRLALAGVPGSKKAVARLPLGFIGSRP